MKRVVIGLVAAATITAGCGDDSDDLTDPPTTVAGTEGSMDASTGMNDMSDMGDGNMGDPSATPAAEVEGAEIDTGTFELLDTRPQGYDDVAGEATIARSDAGTTVTVELVGLMAGVEYVAHLHEGTCVDNGGAHFRFDREGGEVPPNEIHLRFVADADGNGFMTAVNARRAGAAGRSVVVHPVDLLDNKIACADLGP